MQIQGKIIIVTGGADGIGAALCRRFAREGAAHIAVVDLNAEGAAKVAAGIGGSSYGVDVSDPAAVEAMVRAVEAAHRAFSEGPWARMLPSERGRLLRRLDKPALQAACIRARAALRGWCCCS